jgi:hypothetical protein
LLQPFLGCLDVEVLLEMEFMGRKAITVAAGKVVVQEAA